MHSAADIFLSRGSNPCSPAQAKLRGTAQPTAELALAYWSFQEGVALVALYEASELSMEQVAPIWRAGIRALLRP